MSLIVVNYTVWYRLIKGDFQMAGKLVYVRMKPRTKAHGTGYWPQAKRIEAVTLHLSVGSLPEVSRIMGIPYKTLEMWKSQDWWKELVTKLQSSF